MTGFEWTEGVGDRTMISTGTAENGTPVVLIHYTLLDVIEVQAGTQIRHEAAGAVIVATGGTTVAQIDADGEDLDRVLRRHGFVPVTPVETPDPFVWHNGIPSRDRFCYGRVASVPVKVTHLTLLGMMLIEETDAERLPVRTLSSIDLPAGVDPETVLRSLTVVPA